MAMLLLNSGVHAASWQEFEAPRGDAINQTFLGGDGSLLRTRAGATCIASRPINIAESTYRDPSGQTVAFADIQRSVAANVAFLAAPYDHTRKSNQDAGSPDLRVRIEFKFALRADRLTLALPDDQSIDLAPFIEASGDSVLVDDPALAQRLRRLISDGHAIFVESWSLDTGRAIRDRLPAPGFMTFDACLTAADGLPDHIVTEAATAPSITVTPLKNLPGGFAAMDAQAPICDAPRPGLRYETARIDEISGFIAPSERAFVGYDDNDRPVHVRAPGIFDAAGAPGEAWPSAISIAADTNDPTTPNAVKGCLGAAVARLCLAPAQGNRGALTLGGCIGDLAGGFDLLSAELLGAAPVGDGSFSNQTAVTMLSAPTEAVLGGGAGRSAGAAGTGSVGFGGGGGAGAGGGFGPRVRDGGASSSETGGNETPRDATVSLPDEITVVPLPPSAMLLLIGACAMLAWARRRGATT